MKPEDTVKGEGPGEFYSPMQDEMREFGNPRGKRKSRRGGKRRRRRGTR